MAVTLESCGSHKRREFRSHPPSDGIWRQLSQLCVLKSWISPGDESNNGRVRNESSFSTWRSQSKTSTREQMASLDNRPIDGLGHWHLKAQPAPCQPPRGTWAGLLFAPHTQLHSSGMQLRLDCSFFVFLFVRSQKAQMTDSGRRWTFGIAPKNRRAMSSSRNNGDASDRPKQKSFQMTEIKSAIRRFSNRKSTDTSASAVTAAHVNGASQSFINIAPTTANELVEDSEDDLTPILPPLVSFEKKVPTTAWDVLAAKVWFPFSHIVSVC